MEEEIADFIRENYSTPLGGVAARGTGLEVMCTGAGRIRVRMPPNFEDVSEFCRNIWEYFQAKVDLVIDDNSRSCVVFEVYCRPQWAVSEDMEPPSPPVAAEIASTEETKQDAPPQQGEPIAKSSVLSTAFTTLTPVAISWVAWAAFTYNYSRFFANKTL